MFKAYAFQSQINGFGHIRFPLYLLGFYHFAFGIKSAKSKPVKSRKPKLPGQIKELAAKNLDAAILTARVGMTLSEIQTHLYFYYIYLRHIETIKSGKASPIKDIMEANAIKWGGRPFEKDSVDFLNSFIQKMADDKAVELGRIFIAAVNSVDSKMIFEIGNAIEFLRTLEQKPDGYRAELLELKQRLDKRGEKWPIRKVAEWIGWPDMSGADGFKTLRRICEELNFPLADSRQKADKPKTNA